MELVPEQRVLDLAHSCAGLVGDELAARLEKECVGDEAFRARVEDAIRRFERSEHTVGFTNDYEKVLPDHYQLIEMVGRGGMAEVFRAEDQRLGRSVAIKFLNSEFRKDPERMRRFNQEARAVSSLNHPNIIIIHDIGENEGVQFIVTEFVEGETLGRRIARGKLGIPEAVDIAMQVASALSASHQAGIVHRDIKPDNIMIRRDGVVKVLDFGLAKETLQVAASAVDDDAATLDRVLTSPGLIMGTPQYMSPEQARGSDLDARTDIFSLGIILFEMVAGRPPFYGPSMVDTIAAIIGKEPRKLEDFVEDPPADLSRIILKALRKDRHERYGTMEHFISDLRDLKVQVVGSQEYGRQTGGNVARTTIQNTIRTVAARFVRWDRLALVGAAAVIVFGFWWFLSGRMSSADSIAGSMRTIPVTNWSSKSGEVVSAASFSPDAKMIAFAATRSDSTEIWAKPTIGGDAIQVTKSGFFNQYPVWSPNGNEVAYVSNRGTEHGLWKASFTGGAQTQIVGGIRPNARPTYWAPSGSIYFQEAGELYKADVESGSRALVTNFGAMNIRPRAIEISNDEMRVAFTVLENDGWKLKTVPVGGSEPALVAVARDQIDHLSWTPDGSAILYSTAVGGASQIFRVPSGGGGAVQISSGDMDFHVLDVAPDGSQILYGSVSETSDLWRVGLDDGREMLVANEVLSEYWPAFSPDGSQIAFQSVKQVERPYSGAVTSRASSGVGPILTVSPNGFAPAWSIDGEWLAFFRRSEAGFAIWRVRATGADASKVADGWIDVTNYSPTPYVRIGRDHLSWSRDGKFIAYTARPQGISNLFLAAADGSGTSQVTKNNDPSVFFSCPTWTADGKIIIRSEQTPQGPGGRNKHRLSLVDVAGGAAKTLVESDASFVFLGVTENGEDLVLAQRSDPGDLSIIPKATDIYLHSIATGARSRVHSFDLAYLYNIHLSRDGKSLAFVTSRDNVTALWTVPVKGGTPRQLMAENDPKILISELAWSPDGRSIVYGKQTRTNLISMLAK